MKKSTDSVRIVCFDENSKKFLLLTEADDPDNFKLPGGKFEGENESPEQAAIRELGEELGLGGDIHLKFVTELINDDGISKRFIFICRTSVEDVIPSTEIFKVIWVDEHAIPHCKNERHIMSAVRSVGLPK